MKLCGRVNWCRIGWLVVFFNLLFCFDIAWSQNVPPVLNKGIPNQHAEAGTYFTYTIPSTAFKDRNNDELTYTATIPPSSWLAFNGNTFSGNPVEGTVTVKVTAKDPSNDSISTTFTINVNPQDGTYAAFTMNYQMGCNSQYVQFENKSNGSGTQLFEWDFGNGNFSTLPNPIANYTQPGNYTVKLTITNSPEPKLTWTETIIIHESPVPNIAPVTGNCEPFGVTLNSTGDAGKYYTWYSAQFPQGQQQQVTPSNSLHLDSLQNGIYNVDLTVTDANGCEGLKNVPDLFEVYDKPTAGFRYQKIDACRSFEVNFYDSSKIEGSQITGYLWKVDGIQKGTSETFNYDFKTWGSYVVTLIGTSEHNCVSYPFSKTINFNNNNTAKFTFNPATTCSGDSTHFTSLVSPGITSYAWDFDNNGTTDNTTANPSWAFSSGGQKPVKLKASFSDGCIVEKTENIPVEEITADFNFSSTGLCLNTFTLNLSDQSSSNQGINSWEWYLNGNLVSILTNPNPLPLAAGNYDILLKVVGSTGCKATVKKSITLSNTTIGIIVGGSGTHDSNCFTSEETQFTAVYNSDYDHTISSYTWDFGDGTTGSGLTTTHTYLAAGNYTVSLDIKTTNCTYSTTLNNAVQLVTLPSITSIDFTQSDSCLNASVDLNVDYTSGIDQLIFTTYPPVAGISETIEGISGTNYTYNHSFQNIGTYSINVVGVDNGCQSDESIVTGIRINGPKALFGTSQASFCETYNVQFINQSSSLGTNTNYLWDFGDLQTSNLVSPTHSYITTGTFDITLTATDTITACSDSYFDQISIYSFDKSPGFITTKETTGCAPLDVNLDLDLKRFSANFEADSYIWDFDNNGTWDDTTQTPSVQYKYYRPGLYSVGLKIIGKDGCVYDFTENDLIHANGSIVSFSFPATVCSGSDIQFTNTSTYPPGYSGSPESYSWDFGDGISGVENPIHKFATDDTFFVSLTITDKNLCKSEKRDSIKIQHFTSDFSASPTTACMGSTVTFQNEAYGTGLTCKWNFGDGSPDFLSSETTVTHKYSIPGDFNPTLQVTTASGCTKTSSQPLHIINTTSGFKVEDDIVNIGCAPAFAHFIPFADDNDVASYFWDFGDGVTSWERDPRHKYYTPGYYDVSLQVVFKEGCDSTTTYPKYIFAAGAKGTLNYDATPHCGPDTVSFSLTDMLSVDSISWDFGNGYGYSYSVDRPSSLNTSYIYTAVGYTKPSVVLTSNECLKSYAYEKISTGPADPVRIYTSVPPQAKIGIDYQGICQGVPIQFSDSSKLMDIVYPASEWKWAFNDVNGGSATTQNTSHAYSQVGNVSPSLRVSNSLGCSDSVTLTNGIFIYKKSALVADFIPPEDPVCPNSIVDFFGTFTNYDYNIPITNWAWNFGDGNSAYSQNTTHAYNKSDRGKTLDVLLVATDSVQCSDSTYHTVAINNLQAVIGYSPQPVYRGGFVDFSDESVTSLNDNVNTWEWHFENGSNDYSASKNPQDIQYNDIRTNNVQLTVTSQMGCTDTVLGSLPVLNNPPELESFDINTLINTRYNFSVKDFEEHFTDRDSDVGQKLEGIQIASLPDNGELYFGNSVISGPTTISRSEISELYYISTNEGADDFLWNAFDGTDYAGGAATVNIKVNPIPPAPTLDSLVFNIREDSVLTFSLSTFRDYFTNSLMFDGFSLNILKIETIFTSTQGTLTYNSTPVFASEEFSGEQIEYGYFTVTPTTGYDGKIIFYWNGFDSLKWGEDPAKVIINYINSPPELTAIIRESLKEDNRQTITKAEFLTHYSDSDLNDNATTFFLNISAGTPGTFKIYGTPPVSGNSIAFNQFDSVTYTPKGGLEGSVEISWGASDGQDTASAIIRFVYVNTPPIAHDIFVKGDEDKPLTFWNVNFDKNYRDKGPFEDDDIYDKLDSIRIETLPPAENGYLVYEINNVSDTIETNETPYLIYGKHINFQLKFIPFPNWNGTTSLQYSAFDTTDWSANQATVFITIANVNDPPTPQNDTYNISEDKKLIGFNVMANDSDIDDSIDSLTVSIVDEGTAGLNGIIVLDSLGNLTYTPKADSNGTVRFTYNLCDPSGLCSTATVTIFIKPENDPPVALDDENSLLETTDSIVSNSTNKLLANDSDIDVGDFIYVLKINSETKSKWGTLDWHSDGSYTYYNNINATDSLYSGEEILDMFPYTLSDSLKRTATAILTIKITGVNDNPKAYSDTLSLGENDASATLIAETDGLLDNDTDIDGDDLHVAKFGNMVKNTDTTHFGSITWNENGSIVFVPRYLAVDSLQEGELVTEKFLYVTSDKFGGSDSAWLFIYITGVNDVPIAFNDSVFINEDTDSIKGGASDFSSLINNDDDIDGDSIIITLINNQPSKETFGNFGHVVWDSLGNYTYFTNREITDTLAQNETVYDEYIYTLKDINGAETTAKLIIEITGINDPPKALPDTYFTKDVNPIIVTETDTTQILFNDSDVDGHKRKLTSVNESAIDTTMGKYGKLNWDSTGSFTYLPYPAFAQSLRPLVQVVDTFTYTVADEFKAVDDTLLYYIIEGINNAPIARNDTLIVSEDDFSKQLLPLPGLLKEKNVDDPDLDTLKVLKIKGSENDSIPGDLDFGYIKWDSTGKVDYYPYQDVIHQLAWGEYFTETFSYTIVDEGDLTAQANLIVRIIGENDPVKAIGDYAEVYEDSTLKYDVVENDEDVDNDSFGNFNYNSLTILINPRHGKATSNTFNGEIIYSPKENYFGPDSLKYQICDTGKPYYCDEAWLKIDVLPVNDPPQPINLELTTPKNTPVGFEYLAQFIDIDDGINPDTVFIPLDYSNKVKKQGDQIIYTPEKDSVGVDEFTYSMKDYFGDAAYVIVQINVFDPLSDFKAQNDTVSIFEDQSVNVEVAKNDTLGAEFPDPRTVEIRVVPRNGVALFDTAKLVVNYKPEPDFYGSDSLTYILYSGYGIWSSAKVYFEVKPINDPIVAFDDAAEVYYDSSVVIPVLANDFDPEGKLDTASFQILQGPSSGTPVFSKITGKLKYKPNLGFKGIDSLVYKICDSDKISSSCDTARVFIVVKSDVFSAKDDYYKVDENDPKNDLVNPHSPFYNDKNLNDVIKVDSSTFKVVSGPLHGKYSFMNGIVSYAPAANYFGDDYLIYAVSDEEGNSDFAKINIWVNEVNTAPVAVDDNAIVTQNTFKRLRVLDNDYDIDGTLKFSTLDTIAGKGPRNGEIQIDNNTGTILYKPFVNKGKDQFTYKICDNQDSCDEATVYISIQLETTVYLWKSTKEDTPVSIGLTPEMVKRNLSFSISTIENRVSPKLGDYSVTNTTGEFTYTPKHDIIGNDTILFTVWSQNRLEFAHFRIYINILPVNDAPVAINDTIHWLNATSDKIINFDSLLINDYDVDGDQILMTESVIKTGYDKLHVAFNADSTITITADTILWCEAWFTYEIRDKDGLMDSAKVTIWPKLAGIKAVDDRANVDENTLSNFIDVLVNDQIVDNQRCTIDTVIIITQPKHGTAIGTTDNFVDYKPTSHYYGPDSLEYQIADRWGQTSSAWVYIIVIEKNTPPVALPDIISSDFGKTINIPVLLNDYDPDALNSSNSQGDPNAKIISSLTHLAIGSYPLFGDVKYDKLTSSFVYTHKLEGCDDDYFEYTIIDNEGDSATAKVTIILPDVAPLFIRNDVVKTYPGVPFEVFPLRNDSGYFLPYIDQYTKPLNGSITVIGDTMVIYRSNPDFMGRDSMKYTVTSECGNEQSAYIIFKVEELRVPEIISPNGDGKNDVLIIDGIEYFPDNFLQIFNRYGHVVYQKKTYDNRWGGYSNKGSLGGDKRLPAGTYYYTLIYNEGRNRQAGFIYLFW